MLKRLFSRTPKTYQVDVEPFGATVTVGARETILKAALDAGLAYPFECQTGACACCKALLVEGKVKALTDLAYVFDMEEIRDGYILPCQALARSNLKIRVTALDDVGGGRGSLEAQLLADSDVVAADAVDLSEILQP